MAVQKVDRGMNGNTVIVLAAAGAGLKSLLTARHQDLVGRLHLAAFVRPQQPAKAWLAGVDAQRIAGVFTSQVGCACADRFVPGRGVGRRNASPASPRNLISRLRSQKSNVVLLSFSSKRVDNSWLQALKDKWL